MVWQLTRASFSGIFAVLTTGTYAQCSGELLAIAYRKAKNPNRSLCWLTPRKQLEITDNGLGLIGDDCGIYTVERKGLWP